MGLDPTKDAQTLVTRELDPVSLQNSKGMKRETIPDIPSGVMLAQIVAISGRPMTSEEFWKLREYAQKELGIIEVQMVFADLTPSFPDHKLDLYLSSHLRATRIPVEIPVEPKEGA